METCLNSFDEDVALDVGYVVVEREHQLVILTYGDVSVETAVDDYGYATGTLLVYGLLRVTLGSFRLALLLHV